MPTGRGCACERPEPTYASRPTLSSGPAERLARPAHPTDSARAAQREPSGQPSRARPERIRRTEQSVVADRTLEAMRTIEVFADVGCPFAHVGLREVLRLRESSGHADVRLRVRPWPLELVNGVAMEAAAIAEEVADLRRSVAPDLFRGFDPGHYPSTTLPALELAELAYSESDLIGERVSLALRDALFEEGRDVSDPAVLEDIGTSFGLGATGPLQRDAVIAEWQSGQARHVTGSPHFFCGTSEAFCPSLRITKVGAHLEIRDRPESIETFLASCFAG